MEERHKFWELQDPCTSPDPQKLRSRRRSSSSGMMGCGHAKDMQASFADWGQLKLEVTYIQVGGGIIVKGWRDSRRVHFNFGSIPDGCGDDKGCFWDKQVLRAGLSDPLDSEVNGMGAPCRSREWVQEHAGVGAGKLRREIGAGARALRAGMDPAQTGIKADAC
ncbi:hypothetical protein K503DRAFT_816814 [Rhizopogon vinicolor AM-OR11-026]|uniref:Uncharacterized protein n=1 Tax=Rhizopogon vinicolor AM-OR11-026 TaxID=1314800 RepID=A0A1B7MEB4_9AGAM|nr:hypothetical protein K503DRAFT_816814 [Rhizopogon vinicolor AM-OR11-026]